MSRRIILVALLLGGCAIPKSPPVVTPTTSADMGLVANGLPGPTIDASWWRAFGDPQLDRIVADATAGSPTLAAALARVRQADAVLASRGAELGPNVTLDASGQVSRLSGRYTIPPPYGGSTRFLGSVLTNLNWTLDLFGRQQAAIEGARASRNAAALDVTAARLALAGAVAQAYVDMARAERTAEVAQSSIKTRERSLQLTQVRKRNQLASKIDTTAAETLLAQARATLVAAQGQRALAANALAALAGRGPDYAAAIRPTALRYDGLTLPAAIPADLIARRADIAAGQERIAAAAAGRQVARRAFYPNVNLAALAGFQAVGVGNLFSMDAGTVGVGPAIHLPIFDNGRLKADLKGATAALDLATADYNEQVVTAVREAADAVALDANLSARRTEQDAVVKGFSETGRLNDVRVRSGLSSRLDLIDNDVRLLDAQLAAANLAADAARNRIALVLALGGGYLPEEPQ